jgi:hypothetical protein
MDRRTLLRIILAGSAFSKATFAAAQAGESMNPSPRLTLNAAIKNGTLRLDYVIENLSATDLYVQTGLSDLDRIFTSPGIAFAALDKVVTVYRIPTQTPDRDSPLLVLMCLLRAGGRFRDSIELDLPLRERDQSPSCHDRASTYRGLRFSTEYIWHFPGVRMERIRIRDIEVDQPIFPLVRKLPGGSLVSDAITLDIPVTECAET